MRLLALHAPSRAAHTAAHVSQSAPGRELRCSSSCAPRTSFRPGEKLNLYNYKFELTRDRLHSFICSCVCSCVRLFVRSIITAMCYCRNLHAIALSYFVRKPFCALHESYTVVSLYFPPLTEKRCFYIALFWRH